VPRLLLLAAFIGLVVPLLGCKSEPPPADVARLEVQLPEFKEFPDRKRHAKLTVAGKEQMVPLEKSGKTITVEHKPDGKATEVEMELSFWPVRYSNTIRKKTVKFKAGEVTKVDMTKADDSDRFEAIFVETPDPVVEEMMKIGKVNKDDTVIDIGCGNGVVVIKAVKVGAKSGVGVDIQEWLVDESKKKAKEEGVADKCEFRVEDALKMKDLSPYSVVFLCLGEDLQTRLTPLFKKTLRPGSRIVAHTHLIEGWTPDQTVEVSVPGRTMKYPVYLWNIK
jgi:ribosomal protein L11 methylase PrmA